MEKIILIFLVLLSVNSTFAGLPPPCHDPIFTDREVLEVTPQGFLSVTATLKNSGCSQSLIVRIKGVSEAQSTHMKLLATRPQQFAGVGEIQVPVTLNTKKFLFLDDETLEISGQLRAGDTLFLDIPSAGIYPFIIQ